MQILIVLLNVAMLMIMAMMLWSFGRRKELKFIPTGTVDFVLYHRYIHIPEHFYCPCVCAHLAAAGGPVGSLVSLEETEFTWVGRCCTFDKAFRGLVDLLATAVEAVKLRYTKGVFPWLVLVNGVVC